MSGGVKHVMSGDEVYGWTCWQCDFFTKDVTQAAEHDGSYGPMCCDQPMKRGSKNLHCFACGKEIPGDERRERG